MLNLSFRRWLRFRLKTLMALVTVVSVLLGWRQSLIRESCRERDAVTRFEASYGKFDYASRTDELGTISLPRTHDDPDPDSVEQFWPEWLVGDRYLLDPEWAYFALVYDTGGLGIPPTRKDPWCYGTDDALRLLQCLPSLRAVSTGISEEISDVGLGYIAHLPRLETLVVRRSKVTDLGLIQLEGCSTLRYLDLSESRISDKGLSSIALLRDLRALVLEKTKITDNGLDFLRSLQELRRLGVNRTAVADAGLSRLCRLPNLRVLDIEGTLVSDAGLSQLLSLRQLRLVRAGASRVTPNGARQLEERLPGVTVKLDVEKRPF
jgi:Leucine-rich repeat (LRR) protein